MHHSFGRTLSDTMSRHLRLVAGIAVASVVLMACTATPANQDDQTSTPENWRPDASAPFGTLVSNGTGGGHLAGLEGELMLEAGCLVVQHSESGTTYALVVLDILRPQWDEASATLTVADQQQVVGDNVSFGGSEASPDVVAEAVMGEQCRERDAYFLVQHPPASR